MSLTHSVAFVPAFMLLLEVGPSAAMEPDGVRVTKITVTINRGRDVGQNFGSLFEAKSKDGSLVIGAGFPNTSGSGQYGARRNTVKNLRVIRVDAENNRLYLLGAVPGPTTGIVVVRRAKTPPAWARRAEKEAAS